MFVESWISMFSLQSCLHLKQKEWNGRILVWRWAAVFCCSPLEVTGERECSKLNSFFKKVFLWVPADYSFKGQRSPSASLSYASLGEELGKWRGDRALKAKKVKSRWVEMNHYPPRAEGHRDLANRALWVLAGCPRCLGYLGLSWFQHWKSQVPRNTPEAGKSWSLVTL